MQFIVTSNDKVEAIKKIIDDIDREIDIQIFKKSTLKMLDTTAIKGEDLISRKDLINTLADMVFSKIY